MPWDNEKTSDLLNTVLALKSLKEARLFFRDLMTEKELIEMGRRWQAARMLDKNIPYSRITQETSLSSATVARIAKWLKEGTGGYRLMINRQHHTHHAKTSPGGKRVRC